MRVKRLVKYGEMCYNKTEKKKKDKTLLLTMVCYNIVKEACLKPPIV